MSGINASLWRRAALALLAGAALAFPMGAKADITDGLSVRIGTFMPQRGNEANTTIGLRQITDFNVWGAGLDYKVNLPALLNGEHWSTSVSADLFYSERKSRGILRYIPVAINQVYTFEEQGGATPFLGFSLVAATFGANGVMDAGYVVSTPMVTRFGAGLVVGANFPGRLYLEGRYEWIDKHSTPINPEGFRVMLGYRF